METESILLAKTAYGEDTQRLLFLCARSGFFAAFKKSSKRLTGKVQPDLFDTATVLFEEGRKNKVLFLKSYDTKVRREKISKQYKRFEIACRLARLIINNGAYLEDALQTFRLTEVALDAFNNLNAPPPLSTSSSFIFYFDKRGSLSDNHGVRTYPREMQKSLHQYFSFQLKIFTNTPLATVKN